MSRRRVRHGQTTSMNRLYAIEAGITNTGSVADHRMSVKPSQIEAVAWQILRGQPSNPILKALLEDLNANRGASVVIAGEEQPPVVHAIAHALNSHYGNIGTTVLVTDPVEVAPANQLASLMELVRDMNAGAVKALIILGGNPVFDAPVDLHFKEALDKVPFRAHHSLYYDETSLRCHWHVPDSHWLENWSDARAHDGTVSIVQPLISPLYNGRSVHEVLGALIGGLDQTPYQTVRTYWFSKGANEQTWRKWLHDGVVENSALPTRAAVAAPPTAQPSNRATEGIEIELRPDPNIYDGRFANNAWLQELPKPQTKITWDNVLVVGPATAAKIGYGPDERDPLVNERRTKYAVVAYHGVKMSLPIWVVPGQPEDVATIYFGYGRTNAGKVGSGVGFNTYPFRFSNALHGGGGATIKIDEGMPVYPIGCVQEHQSIDPRDVGERGIIRAATFAEYLKNPHFAQEEEHGVEAEAVHAVRERTLRAGVSRRGHVAQRRRSQRHDLQPLHRHALLLEQLPVQSAALQLLPLRRLRHARAQADAQSRRHGPHARRDGEVHVLRAAHQPGEDRRRKRKPPRARRRSHDRVRAGLPDRGNRLRRQERPDEPRREIEGGADELHAARTTADTPAHDVPGDDSQSASVAGGGRTQGINR